MSEKSLKTSVKAAGKKTAVKNRSVKRPVSAKKKEPSSAAVSDLTNEANVSAETKPEKKVAPKSGPASKKSAVKKSAAGKTKKAAVAAKKVAVKALKKNIKVGKPVSPAPVFTTPYPEVNMGEQLFTPEIEPQAADEKLKKQVAEYNTLPFRRTYRGLAFYLTLFVMLMTLLFAWLSGDSDILFGLGFIVPILYLVYRSYRTSYIIAIIWWSLEKLIQLTEVTRTSAAVSVILWWILISYVYFRAMRVEMLRLKEDAGRGRKVSYRPLFRDLALAVVMLFVITFGVAFISI